MQLLLSQIIRNAGEVLRDRCDRRTHLLIKSSGKQANKTIVGLSNWILIAFPLGDFRPVRVEIAPQFIAAEAEMFSKKSQLLTREPGTFDRPLSE